MALTDYANDLHAQDRLSPLEAFAQVSDHRLPREFQELAGSTAEIYQITHDVSFAFLVKVIDHPQERLSTGSNSNKELIKGGVETKPLTGEGTLLGCLAEIAGSRLIDSHQKLYTRSESCTDNTRSSESDPSYVNNNPFFSYQSGETLSDLALPLLCLL